MANVDIGFALNYMYATLVNITPDQSSPTWAWVGPGITDLTNDRSEKTDENEDYSTGGNTETTVTGVTASTSVSGNRLIGDPFQDWLASIEECFGSERETQRRIVSPTGEIIQDKITVKDIVVSGPNGAASSKQGISCTFARNDTPEIIQAAKGTHLPSSISASDVAVSVDDSVQVSPTVSPATASNWCLFAIEDTSIARVTADGVVTGLKAGTTRLAIKCAAKPSIRKTVDVVVAAASADTTPSVTVSPSRSSVAVGSTRKLTATPVPSNASVTWESSDTDKATVSENGTVTGVAAGSATITATIEVDSTEYTDTCAVTVTAASS